MLQDHLGSASAYYMLVLSSRITYECHRYLELSSSEGGKAAAAAKRKKAAGAGGVSRGETIPTETHESMRSGLQSVMSTLDDMLAGMKAKK